MTKNKKIKRIGISTGGGDCPGLNAVIRAVTTTAIREYGWEVIGIRDSFKGLIWPDQTMKLTLEVVEDILAKGGTILGTTNRGNPFKWEKRKRWQGRDCGHERQGDGELRASRAGCFSDCGRRWHDGHRPEVL